MMEWPIRPYEDGCQRWPCFFGLPNYSRPNGVFTCCQLVAFFLVLQQHVSVNLPNEAGFRIEFVLNYPVTVGRISDG